MSSLIIDTTTHVADPGDYYSTDVTRDKICLHHTAGGSLIGAVETLRKIDGIMVHFIIDKDGKIYQLMPIKNFGFHLGIKNTGGSVDKATFGIEVVAFGGLKLKGDTLYSWPSNFNNRYCSLADDALYVDNGEEWRGYRYWTAFTNEQYASVARLCGYLCYNFDIPPEILPNVNEYNLEAVKKFKGIFTHTSCRLDKLDISVSFNWSIFAQNLKTAFDYYKENNVTGLTV